MVDDDGNNPPWPPDNGRRSRSVPELGSAFNTLFRVPIEDAPIDAAAAHRLHEAGLIFMANRHSREFVELVVRPATT